MGPGKFGRKRQHTKASMKRVLKPIAAAVMAVGVLGIAGVSHATHNVPQKAGKFASEVVTAYQNCAYPGDATTSNGFPACTPTARFESSLCNFGSKGKGKVQAKVKVDTTGIKGLCGSTCKGCDTISKPCVPAETCDTTAVCIDMKLSGLTSCPAGTTLAAAARVNVTTDDCPSGACTVTIGAGGSLPLTFGFPTGTVCTVDTKGNCAAKATVNGVLPGTLQPGKLTGIEIRGVNFIQTGAGGPEDDGNAFSTGILVP
jgi:hypothetical protein